MRKIFRQLELVVPLVIVVASVMFLMQREPEAAAQPTVASAPSAEKHSIKGTVNHISIPALAISLDVRQGRYDAESQAWTLDDTHAFINADQPFVSNQADAPLAFIYGHDTNAIFARTANLKPNDSVMVTTVEGKTFTYVYNRAFLVDPANVSVLTNNQYGQLVLFSCDGLFSQQRRVMYFTFEKVEDTK